MPASGHQDHTISPSASALFVQQRFRVHRIPSRVDDVGQRPSVGKDARISASDLPDGTSGIFFWKDWTGQISLISLTKFAYARNGRLARPHPSPDKETAPAGGVLGPP